MRDVYKRQPARSLKHGVQARFFPVQRREIDVHARLDQRSRDHTAGLSLPQSPAHLVQHRSSVRGVHQRGQVKITLSFKPVEDLPGGFSGVDDAQNLRVCLQLRRQRIPCLLYTSDKVSENLDKAG